MQQGRLEEELMSSRLREVEGVAELKELRLKVMELETQTQVMYCTVLYCTTLYCNVLHCTALYYTVLYCAVLYATIITTDRCANVEATENWIKSALTLTNETLKLCRIEAEEKIISQNLALLFVVSAVGWPYWAIAHTYMYIIGLGRNIFCYRMYSWIWGHLI